MRTLASTRCYLLGPYPESDFRPGSLQQPDAYLSTRRGPLHQPDGESWVWVLTSTRCLFADPTVPHPTSKDPLKRTCAVLQVNSTWTLASTRCGLLGPYPESDFLGQGPCFNPKHIRQLDVDPCIDPIRTHGFGSLHQPDAYSSTRLSPFLRRRTP